MPAYRALVVPGYRRVKKTSLAVVAGLCAALACKSEKHATPFATSLSTLDVPSAAPSAPAALKSPQPTKLTLALETEKLGQGPALRVFVSAPALQLREPIGETRFPFTCVALAAEGEHPWRVSCSPRYRKTLAEARLVAGELVLQVLAPSTPPREVRKPLPPNHVLELLDADASSRLESCDGVTPTRQLEVTFPSANWYSGFTPDSITYLALPGLAEPLPLVKEVGWWRGCHAVAVEGAVEFRCPAERHHFARITTEDSAVRYEWQDTERHVGRVLLPCNAKAKLVAPATFNTGNRYF
jgi:hypothetical protein